MQHDEYSRGEEPDPRSGHSCTDMHWLLVFLVALGGFAGMFCWGLARGDVERLYRGIDHKGQVCGVTPAVAGKRYLYWCQVDAAGEALVLDRARPICVDQCPGHRSSPQPGTAGYQVMTDCSFGGARAMASYRTVLLRNRYCLPDTALFPGAADEVAAAALGGAGLRAQGGAASILAAWPVLLGAFLVALVLGYLYLAALRFCAEAFIRAAAPFSVVGLAALGLHLWLRAGYCGGALYGGRPMPSGVGDQEASATRAAAWVCWLLSAVLACVGCCLKDSVRSASACVEVASNTIFEMPSLLLVPASKALCNGVAISVLMYGFLAFYSTGDVVGDADGLRHYLQFAGGRLIMLAFYCFMSLWIVVFLNALLQFMVCYAVVEYYYTDYDHDGEKDAGCCAIWDGLAVGICYHFGSLAVGSLLLASLQVLQKVIENTEHGKTGAHNVVAACMRRCVGCCAFCCRERVECMSGIAFADMAITSDSFCGSADSATRLVAEIGGSIEVLNGATCVFSVFGAAATTACCAGFGHVLASSGAYADHESAFFVDSPVAAMVASGVIGAAVSASFMSLPDMTIDTLLYCYGYDFKNNRSGFTAPQALKELVHDHDHGGIEGPMQH